MDSNYAIANVLGLPRNAKTKHDIKQNENVGAQGFAPAFNKACAQHTP